MDVGYLLLGNPWLPNHKAINDYQSNKMSSHTTQVKEDHILLKKNITQEHQQSTKQTSFSTTSKIMYPLNF